MSTTVKSAPIPPSRQREKPGQPLKWIGKNIKRVEDPRLLTGQGRYIDDIDLPNMLHAAVLRSTRAHARIKSIDVSAAAALKSVVKVLTGADVARATGPLPCFSNPTVEQRCVAVGRVRHVGEAVAVVVAESRYVAEDALDLIAVEYEDLPVMSDPEEAVKATGDGVLHPERGPTNVAMQRRFTFGPVEADFAGAARIVRRRLRWPRSGAQPLETVGAVAEYESGAGKFTVHMNSSMYNYVGWTMALSLGVPAHKINLVPVIAGGSFGSKLFTHKVCVLAASLARICGRPVKYIEDRIDNFTSCDNHGSDRIYDTELALDADNRMIGLRCKVLDDYGAYFQFGVGHHGNALSQIVGPYRIRSVDLDVTAVLTNKCQQGAYRGFGSEVSNFVIERMVDAAVDELGLDPVEFRRRNFIRPEDFPYKIPTGNLYDSGNYGAVLDEALRLLDYDGWRRKQAEYRKQGRYVGIGIATCQERSVFSATEFWMLNEEAGFALTSSPEGVSVKIDAARQDRGLAERAVLGQQPRDRGDHDPGRAVEDRSGRHQHRLFRHRPRSRRNGPRRQPLYGDGRGRAGGRRRHHQGKAVPRRRPHAGSEPGRSGAARRQSRREGRAGAGEDHRRDRDACPFLPAVHARRSDADQRHGCRLHLRSSAHDAALGRPLRPRHLLSDHGTHVSHAGGRGRRWGPVRCASSITSRCTTAARW